MLEVIVHPEHLNKSETCSSVQIIVPWSGFIMEYWIIVVLD